MSARARKGREMAKNIKGITTRRTFWASPKRRNGLIECHPNEIQTVHIVMQNYYKKSFTSSIRVDIFVSYTNDASAPFPKPFLFAFYPDDPDVCFSKNITLPHGHTSNVKNPFSIKKRRPPFIRDKTNLIMPFSKFCCTALFSIQCADNFYRHIKVLTRQAQAMLRFLI